MNSASAHNAELVRVIEQHRGAIEQARRISSGGGGQLKSAPENESRVQHAESVRLYGLPGAERMYFDPAEVYECEIDGNYDEGDVPEGGWTVEEWTVADPLTLLPDADWMLELMQERLCEEHVHDYGDECDHIFKNAEVLAAAEALRQTVARKVTYHQAEKQVGSHVLTMVGDDPFLDGEPMYRPALIDGRACDAG